MAIKWSEKKKSGIKWSERELFIPEKYNNPPQPAPINQLDAITNTRNFFNTRQSSKDAGKFQVFGAQISRLVPVPEPLGESRYNPFASLENNVKINTNVKNTTPVLTDANTLKLLGEAAYKISGAIRASTDWLTLPITIAVNAISAKKNEDAPKSQVANSTPSMLSSNKVDTKYLIEATAEMARKDIKSGGTWSMHKAAQTYLKSRNVVPGGKSPDIQDISVLASLALLDMFGDPLLAVPVLKTAREFVVWKNVGKLEKPLAEGATLSNSVARKSRLTDTLKVKTTPMKTTEFLLADNLKVKIIPKKNSVVFKSYIKRGSKGEILNSPFEIEGVAAETSKAVGKEIVATVKGSDLILSSTGKDLKGVLPVEGILSAKPIFNTLDFAGQELLKPTQQTVQPTTALDFNAQPEPVVPAEQPLTAGQVVEPNKIVLETANPAKAQYESEVLAQLDMAEAGYRIPQRSEGADGTKFVGVKSTFPDWIPADLRLNAVIKPTLVHINNGTIPTKAKELRLYNEIKGMFDSYGQAKAELESEINVADLFNDDVPTAKTDELLTNYKKQYGEEIQQEKLVSGKDNVAVSTQEKAGKEIDPKNFKTADEFVKAHGTPVTGTKDSLFRGTTMDEWESIKSGGYSGKQISKTQNRTWLAEDIETAQQALTMRGGKGEVIIEFKPDAKGNVFKDQNSGYYRADNLGINDVVKVTDKNGKVIYEATTGGKTKSQLTDIWNKANKEQNLKSETVDKTSQSGIKADKGSYSDIESGKTSSLKRIETPEQYRLAKAINGGDMTFIMKTSSRYNGYFSPSTKEIAMNRKLYKRGKDETKKQYQLRIGKTMAHEIGHFIDYLPDGNMKRGNILGRLLTLDSFKKNFIAEPDLLEQRRKIMNKINKINNDDVLLDNLKNKMIEPLMKQLVDINKQITFSNPLFKDELVKLTHAWKPWDAGYDVSYDKYRKSAAELYADFNSILFNDPALAQELAPNFYKEFFRALGKKPEVEKAFLGIQGELMGDRTSLMAKRYEMLKKSGKDAADRFAATVAEREALNKKPWLAAVMRDAWYQHYWVAKKGPTIKNLMEELDRGFNNQLFIWTEKNIKPISQDLKNAGLDWNDLDAVLKLDRISKDIGRADVANIKGLDVKTAEDVLAEIDGILGTEKANVVMKAAIDIRSALKELQLQFPDLWTPEQIELMKSNDFYAPFNILFKESNDIGYYIKASTGNIDKDFNSVVNTLLRSKSVSHFGEKNVIKKTVIDELIAEGKGDIKKADVSRIPMANGVINRVVKKAPKGWDLVEIKRNGKIESFYLPDDIAHSLNQDDLGTLMSVLKVFSLANKPFKKLYTGIINPGFQVINFFFRDWGQANMFFGPEWIRAQQGKSNVGLNIIANNTYRALFQKLVQIKYYWKAFKNVKEKNLFNKYTPIVEEGLKNHIIEVDASGMYKIDTKSLTEQEEAGIKYILQTMGLTDGKTKWRQVADFGQGIAQSLEETPKLAAYMYMKKLGVIDDNNLSVIRNYVGSPNFWKQGRENKNISSLMMFYNPIIRGVGNLVKKAFVKDAAGKGSRSAFWWRIIRKAIIPAMVGVAAEEGFFDEDIQRQYSLLPEYLKGNYLNIPLGINEKGKVESISIPMDEDARLIHALTRNIFRMALHSGDKEIRKRALVDILAYTGGQVPGTTPTINIARQWSIAYGGGNPYDSFRNQNIFLANEMKLPFSEKAKIMAKWTLNQSGILKLNIHDSVDNRTVTEQIVSYIPIINRFYRFSNRGDYEADQAVVRSEAKTAAVELLAKNKAVKEIVEKLNKDSQYDYSADLLKIAKDRLGIEASDDAKVYKEFELLNNTVQEEYVINFGSIHFRSIINQSNDTKEKVLVNIWDRGAMKEKEYINFLMTASNLKIISQEVLGNVLVKTGLGEVK